MRKSKFEDKVFKIFLKEVQAGHLPSLKDIIAKSGFSKVTFYKHYSSKKQFYFACLDKIADNYIDREQQALSFTERVKRLCMFLAVHQDALKRAAKDDVNLIIEGFYQYLKSYFADEYKSEKTYKLNLVCSSIYILFKAYAYDEISYDDLQSSIKKIEDDFLPKNTSR